MSAPTGSPAPPVDHVQPATTSGLSSGPAPAHPDSTVGSTTGPNQLQGQLKVAQGKAYDTIGNILPAEMGAADWKSSGSDLKSVGQGEVDQAKRQQAIEAVIDRAAGVAKTAVGWLTGDQALQSAGNAEAAKATAAFKQARSDKVIDPPVPSLEGLTGMKESVMGMLTGDQDRQSAGNVQGSKATLRDGI